MESITQAITPIKIHKLVPNSDCISNHVKKSRKIICNIMNGNDDRLLVIVGPCSIHNVEESLEYAKTLKDRTRKFENEWFRVLRTYMEKPRTNIGWKGLLYGPDLNGKCDINKGLIETRLFLKKVNQIGLPCGYECLDPLSQIYLSDFICWGAIGARTVSSQIHRQIVSGLDFPIGFKNNVNGDVDIAINSMISSSVPHTFLTVMNNGCVGIVTTKGNKNTHVILRGDKNKPNYYYPTILKINKLIKNHEKKMNALIMIDCSHGNSQKQYMLQKEVSIYVAEQIIKGLPIHGIMLESNTNAGKQRLINKESLKPGVSITDACINIEMTIEILNIYSNAVKRRRKL